VLFSYASSSLLVCPRFAVGKVNNWFSTSYLVQIQSKEKNLVFITDIKGLSFFTIDITGLFLGTTSLHEKSLRVSFSREGVFFDLSARGSDI